MACQQVTMFEGFPEMVTNIPLKIEKIVKFGDGLWKVSGGCLSQALFLPFLKTYFTFSTLTGPLDIQCVCKTPSPLRGTVFLPTSGCSFSTALKISSTEKLISSFSRHNISYWESHFLGRLIRSLGVPKERGVWNSQGGRKDKLFFFLHIP